MTKQRLFLVLALTAGCSVSDQSASSSLGEATQPIVYGSDDRQDYYQVQDGALRELSRSSNLALIPNAYLHRPNSGLVGIAAPTLEAVYKLCPGQKFNEQPAAAICSGVLIDDDLVLTAGHCVATQKECSEYAFVFDYLYREKGELEDISSSDVYGCRRLIATHSSEDGETDYALVQLDRAPSGRTPVRLRKDPLEAGERLVAVGFPSGLPLKVDLGAEVKEVHGDALHTFALNSDTFEGSSGSGIFDSSGALAGVLVLGGDDYIKTDAGCTVPREVAADAGTTEWGWEQATYASSAIEDLCEQGYPSATLCEIEPSCGDGFCSSDPVDQGCTQDCSAGACAGGGCAKDGAAATPGEPVASEPATGGAKSGCSAAAGSDSNRAWLWLGVLGLCLAPRWRRRSAA